MPSDPSRQPAAYIVTGSWHVPKHYQPLRDALEAKGFRTDCQRLETNKDALPPNNGTLADDTAMTHAAIERLCDDGHPVLVCMHSYGGVVGTNSVRGLSWAERAAQGKSGGVVRLVYCAAFVLAQGSCLLTPFGGQVPPFLEGDDKGFVHMKDRRTAFFNDVQDDDEAQRLLDLCVNFPIDVMSHPLEYEAYRHIPSAYLVHEADAALPNFAQRGMVEATGVEMIMGSSQSGHDGIFTAPKDTSEFVEKCWLQSQP